MRHYTATGKVVCTCISTLPAAVGRRFYRFGRNLAFVQREACGRRTVDRGFVGGRPTALLAFSAFVAAVAASVRRAEETRPEFAVALRACHG